MSIKYTKIAKVEHVAGFDPKTGYYACSKDDKRHVRFGNTLRRVNRQVQIRLFAWKTLLLVFQTSAFVCVYCWFFLYARHLFICEIIEIDLLGNILSGEFITRISDEAKKNARYENVSCVKTLHYVWCTDHRDPLGTRTQDPYIKSVLLYQLS